VQKLIKAVGEIFVTPSYSVDEDDAWYGQAVAKIDEMDACLERLHSAIKEFAGVRCNLSVKESDLSKSLLALASRDNDVSMVQLCSKLAETHDNLSIAEHHRAEMVSYQLESPLKEQMRTTQALKRVFAERVAKWKEWQEELQATSRKRDTKTRLELSGRADTDRARALDEQIESGDERASQLDSDFLTMGDVIRTEYNRYFKQRRDDVKKAVILYLELLIENEGRVLSYWEAFGVETTAHSTAPTAVDPAPSTAPPTKTTTAPVSAIAQTTADEGTSTAADDDDDEKRGNGLDVDLSDDDVDDYDLGGDYGH
jgi:sorting nexin-1/2